jgi:hypothetical protein
VFVYDSFVLLYVVNFLALSMSSSMLLDSLASSSTMLVVGAMGARQLRAVVKSLGARKENLSVGLTINSHGGDPCNDSIVANTQNPKPTNKITQNGFKVVNSTS